MKKRIIVGLVAVAAVAGGLPYVTGYVAESQAKQSIADLNLQSQSRYGQIEIVKYERGYNATYAEYKWVTNPELEQELPIGEIVISCDGVHNMLSYDYSCILKNMGLQEEQIRAAFKGKAPITIEGTIGLTGDETSQVTINPLEIITEQGARITSDGGRMNSTANASLSEISGVGTFSPITVLAASGVEVRISESTFTLDGSMYEKKFFMGDSVFNVDDITVVAPMLEAPLSVKGVSMVSNSDVNDGLYNGKGSLNVAEFTLPASLNNRTNKDVLVKNVTIGTSFADTPFAPIAKLTDYTQKLAEQMSESGAVDPGMVGMDEQFLREQVLALLKKDLAINLWVNSEVNDGALKSHVNTVLTKDITEEFISELETGGALAALKLLQQVDLDILVAIPNSVTELSPEVAMMAAMSNKFVADASGLTAALMLKEGAITLNGEPTSIEALMRN
ncbi:DUF945 family protein [uncultured Amphritea sp.]|uniref:DUF945 family protein n=1 Tax=uncultured Amphritea sp. TaxID=981605 RepID=UPI0026380AB0|nr:DUF945 family protein [uncultured Amphritea sp.]